MLRNEPFYADSRLPLADLLPSWSGRKERDWAFAGLSEIPLTPIEDPGNNETTAFDLRDVFLSESRRVFHKPRCGHRPSVPLFKAQHSLFSACIAGIQQCRLREKPKSQATESAAAFLPAATPKFS